MTQIAQSTWRGIGVPLTVLALAAWLTGCASGRRTPLPVGTDPALARARIESALPRELSDRGGWTTDIYAAFTVLGIAADRGNVCAVAAVIDQESGFHVNPVVPNLASIAWREIDERATRAGIPRAVVHGVLELPSPSGRSYQDRIDGARTEKELSDIFEDLIGSVPLGRTLFADDDPIRTRGPMQVHIVFAKRFAASNPYPYPVQVSIAEEVFTRRGGLYFGVAHLLAYPATYDRYIYRFADFNAGQYASRNAAFQLAVTRVSGIPLIPDGTLVPHDGDLKVPGSTETALRTLAGRIGLSVNAIHDALDQSKTKEFERTALYQRVFALADKSVGTVLPRASIPQIALHGPKITRKLSTEWYAHRVNERFERCLAR